MLSLTEGARGARAPTQSALLLRESVAAPTVSPIVTVHIGARPQACRSSEITVQQIICPIQAVARIRKLQLQPGPVLDVGPRKLIIPAGHRALRCLEGWQTSRSRRPSWPAASSAVAVHRSLCSGSARLGSEKPLADVRSNVRQPQRRSGLSDLARVRSECTALADAAAGCRSARERWAFPHEAARERAPLTDASRRRDRAQSLAHQRQTAARTQTASQWGTCPESAADAHCSPRPSPACPLEGGGFVSCWAPSMGRMHSVRQWLCFP